VAPAIPSRNRVLIIDDDPTVRRMLQRSLHTAGFDAAVAGGGAEGLRILAADSSIGLVLLDLMMPEMDGWKFRHAQRSDPAVAAIPVIVVTGVPLNTIVHTELQAADYLLKPVGREHLISVIGSYCRSKED
jgi:CheY-like chemotaxis protein